MSEPVFMAQIRAADIPESMPVSRKVRGELANYQRFAEVSASRSWRSNEAICEARPPDAADTVSPSADDRRAKKGAPRARPKRRSRPRLRGWPNSPSAQLGTSGRGSGSGGDRRPYRDDAGSAGSLLQQLLVTDAGPPRPAHRLRRRSFRRFVAYRNQIDRDRAGPGHAAPRLLPLRLVPARRRPARRAARCHRRVAVARAARDDRARRARPCRSPRPHTCSPSWPGSRLTDQAYRTLRRTQRYRRHRTHRPSSPTAILRGQVRPLPHPPRYRTSSISPSMAPASPCVPAAITDRAGKGSDGRARTREVKLASLFTQTTIDSTGVRCATPPPPATWRSFDARRRSSPTSYTPKPAAAAPTTYANSSSSVTALPGSGTSPPTILPEATPIVDLYHAREHLHASPPWLTPIVLATSTPPGCPPGSPTSTTATSKPSPPTDRLYRTSRHNARTSTKALAYFKTNAHRMRYAYYRKHGMFVGSGVVEAGCKPSSANDSNYPACLEHPRRHRHHHPALPTSQQPLGQISPHPHNQTATAMTA